MPSIRSSWGTRSSREQRQATRSTPQLTAFFRSAQLARHDPVLQRAGHGGCQASDHRGVLAQAENNVKLRDPPLSSPPSSDLHSSHGMIQCYNALAMVDAKHQIIVGYSLKQRTTSSYAIHPSAHRLLQICTARTA